MPLKGSIRKANPKEIEDARKILEKRNTKIVQTEKAVLTNP